jgi:xanthine dehydrogenase YagR molybdenum-binding subunit
MFGPTAGKNTSSLRQFGFAGCPHFLGLFVHCKTASVSPAVQRAADSAKKKLIQFAVSDKKSPFGGMKPEEVSYENGQLVGGGKTADFGSVLNAMGRSSIEATESAEAGEEKTKYAFHSFGAQFCELRVNQWTNEVRVSRITSVMDAGQVAVTGRQ